MEETYKNLTLTEDDIKLITAEIITPFVTTLFEEQKESTTKTSDKLVEVIKVISERIIALNYENMKFHKFVLAMLQELKPTLDVNALYNMYSKEFDEKNLKKDDTNETLAL